MRLLNETTGELVTGRCRATNLCDYCARLSAVETSELLALDALHGSAPAVWVVLTTRSTDPDPASFYDSRRQLWRAVKRRWPDAEYAGLVEFTTGYGPRSGGARRPHWNLLVKGVPAGDVAALRQLVADVWCGRVDAAPWAQYVGAVTEAGGLLRYVALHFLKESQRPPRGWRGHRFVHSRGYFRGRTPELRVDARRSLRLKRLLWRGLDLEAAELELALAESIGWSLVHVNPSTIERRDPEPGGRPGGTPGRDVLAALRARGGGEHDGSDPRSALARARLRTHANAVGRAAPTARRRE
jgi:hypothetical protein